jgi:PAS domain S-box-containing protein
LWLWVAGVAGLDFLIGDQAVSTAAWAAAGPLVGALLLPPAAVARLGLGAFLLVLPHAIAHSHWDEPRTWARLALLVALSVLAWVLADRRERTSRRVEQIAAVLSNAVAVGDRNGEITYANPAFTELSGLGVERVLGDNWQDFATSPDHSQVLEVWRRFTAGECGPLEAWFRRTDGAEVWILARAARMVDRTGEDEGFVAVYTDITDLKRSQQELLAARDAALAGIAAREELLSRASHELRTPLSAIVGFAELLPQDGPDAEFVHHIRDAGARMLRLVEDLLGVAHPEPASPAPLIDLRDAWPEVVKELGALLEERPHQVVLDAPAPVRVSADPERLQQVFGHLVRNALLHGHSDVVVRATATSSGVRISVRDFGPGIPDADRERALEPFIRLGGADDGSGLGLAVTHRLVATMGGTLSIASPEDGPGTVVHVDLPPPPTAGSRGPYT